MAYGMVNWYVTWYTELRKIYNLLEPYSEVTHVKSYKLKMFQV